MGHRQLPAEAILGLRQRLEQLPPRCAERRQLIQQTSHLYGVSESMLYRALKQFSQIHSLQRADCRRRASRFTAFLECCT